MSYVLEALKKADAERERGAVPGLHAQPVAVIAPERPRQAALPGWAWMSGGAVVVLLSLLVWRVLDQPAPPAPPPMKGNEVVAPSPAVPAASVVVPAAPASVAPAPAAVQPTARPTVRATVEARPSTTAVRPRASAPRPVESASGAQDRIPMLNELPEDLRRQLPPLTIGGSLYSDNASSRFLMVNGQIFHESDQVAPELVLEQIRVKLAVLRYKGQRFRIAF